MNVSNLRFIVDIFTVSLLEYVGDASFKLYAKDKHKPYLILGLFAYAVVIYMLIHILEYSNVIQMNIYWDALSAILETILAYYLLKETLTGVTQYVGFTLIILGLFFMSLGKTIYK
jgi:multidrug transporter EmrE-like cation transporter